MPDAPGSPRSAHPTIERAVLTVDELSQFLADAFPLSPRTYQVTDVTDAGVRMRLPVADEFERPGGTLSGPAMMTLADAAAWLATVSRIGPVALSVTSSLTINFLRKPPLADLWGEAELLRLGRRQSVSDVRLFADVDGTAAAAVAGRPVAQATVTYAIPS